MRHVTDQGIGTTGYDTTITDRKRLVDGKVGASGIANATRIAIFENYRRHDAATTTTNAKVTIPSRYGPTTTTNGTVIAA